jgi:hypothetical protein
VKGGSTTEARNGNEGVVIGVSVGCAVIALAAGILATKKMGKKEDMSMDLDKVEFLPPIQKRSDQELLPPMKLRSDATGVEFCPEDYSVGCDSLSTTQRDIIKPSSGAVEMQAAPKYGLNDTFPIRYPTSSGGQYQDSDSSDSDVDLNDHNEKTPIAVRKNFSHRARNTMSF